MLSILFVHCVYYADLGTGDGFVDITPIDNSYCIDSDQEAES